MNFPKLTFGTPSVTKANNISDPEVIAYSQIFSNLVVGKRYKILLFASIGNIGTPSTASPTVTFSKGQADAFYPQHLKVQPEAVQNWQAYAEYEFVAEYTQMKVQYNSNDIYEATDEVIAINSVLIEGP